MEENRDGNLFVTTVRDRNFLNGARHSVYYRREFDEADLMIDKQIFIMEKKADLSLTTLPDSESNQVHIGGANTKDPRFAIYKGYNGCLSSTVFEF